MQLSPKLLLILLLGSVGIGISPLLRERLFAERQDRPPLPNQWKIQPVEPPQLGDASAHQAFLERQKQLTNRDFSCDCNGCRVAAVQVGVNIN